MTSMLFLSSCIAIYVSSALGATAHSQGTFIHFQGGPVLLPAGDHICHADRNNGASHGPLRFQEIMHI